MPAPTKLAYQREHTGNVQADRSQRLAQQTADTVNQLPFAKGNWIKAQAIGTSPTNISHGLGRTWQGYIITRLRADARVYEAASQPLDATKRIALQASAAVTVDIYFF